MLLDQQSFMGIATKASVTLALAAGLFTVEANARQIEILNSEYMIRHDSGFGAPGIVGGFGPAPVQASLAVGYYQTLGSGNNKSTGIGGIGAFTTTSSLRADFPVGTGISQDWVDAPGHAAAELVIDFSVTWDMYAGFGGSSWSGTPVFASRFFPVVSGNVSDDGWVAFSFTAAFTGYPGGETPGPISGNYFNDTPGSFIAGGTYSSSLSGHSRAFVGVPSDSTIELVGQLKFQAYDGSDDDSSFIQYDGSSTGGILATPIPATLPLMAAGIGAFALFQRRARRKSDNPPA